jgi:hypothetical protein
MPNLAKPCLENAIANKKKARRIQSPTSAENNVSKYHCLRFMKTICCHFMVFSTAYGCIIALELHSLKNICQHDSRKIMKITMAVRLILTWHACTDDNV